MKNIWLIRHGETVYNKSSLIQGQKFDSPLTLIGLAQSIEYAKIINSQTEDSSKLNMYISPVGRAVQTACIIKETLAINTDPIFSPELIELDYDFMSGFSKEEVVNLFPDIMKNREANKWIVKAPKNGESYRDVFNRICFWLSSINNDSDIIIITHSAPSKMIRGALANMSVDRMMSLCHDQNTIYKINMDNTSDNMIIKFTIPNSQGIY